MEKQKMRNIRMEIQQLVDSIKDHADNIAERERIPQLELELILSKVQKLHERIIILNHLNQTAGDAVQGISSRPAASVLSSEEPPATPEPEKVTDFPEPLVEPDPVGESATDPQSEKPEGPAERESVRPEPAPSVASLATELQMRSRGKSLHEKIASVGEDKTLGSKLQQAPVTDLSKAIGINQRFTFIQELFNNDPKAFADSIKHLNSLPGLQDAEEFFFKTLVPQFNWDLNENENAAELLQLIRRRYA